MCRNANLLRALDSPTPHSCTGTQNLAHHSLRPRSQKTLGATYCLQAARLGRAGEQGLEAVPGSLALLSLFTSWPASSRTWGGPASSVGSRLHLGHPAPARPAGGGGRRARGSQDTALGTGGLGRGLGTDGFGLRAPRLVKKRWRGCHLLASHRLARWAQETWSQPGCAENQN